MTKPERNPKSEARSSLASASRRPFCVRHSIFVILSSLVISHSSFRVAFASPGVSSGVQPVALSDARWTHGFWADRFELCRTQMVPSMWTLMDGTNYTQFLQNFRIAAGLAEGRH